MATPFFDYDFTQQLFCLNAASNAAGTKKGTTPHLQDILQQALTQCLPTLKGDWEVVWGPTVYKKESDNPRTGPTNACYVARSASQNTLAIAIAGTSATSPKAWQQDLAIDWVVDFDAWVAEWGATSVPAPVAARWASRTIPLIATGTAFFTHNILSTPAPAGVAGAGSLLAEFLQRDCAGLHLVFTGHSMGGAVAPTVALGLVKAGILGAAAGVSVLPSAGATPGNAAFVAEWVGTFPASDERPLFNTDLFNALDIVPQAFSMDLAGDRYFTKVLEIYNDNVVKNFLARAEVRLLYRMVGNMIKVTMPYANLPGTGFTGEEIPVITTKDDLWKQIKIEHVDCYWTYLKVEEFFKYFVGILTKFGLEELEVEGEFVDAADAEVPEVPPVPDVVAAAADIKVAQVKAEEVPVQEIDV